MSTGGGGINIGGLVADLTINTGDLEPALERGRRAVASFQAELKRLDRDLASGAIDAETYAARHGAVTVALASVTNAMQSAHQTAARIASGMGDAASAMTRAADAAKGLGAAVAGTWRDPGGGLPRGMSDRIGAVQSGIQAQMARNKLEIQSLSSGLPLADDVPAIDARIQQLIKANADLAAKLGRTEAAALKQAAAVKQTGAAAGQAAIQSQQLAGASQSIHTGMDQVQAGANRAGYGLLMFSQLIEDSQYGFRAIVNNVPGVVMALGGTAGLGGAISLASVAVNVWIQNWEHAKDVFRGTGSFDQASRALREIGEAAATAGATLVNLDRGFSVVKVSAKDIETMARSKEEKAAREAEGKAALGDVKELRSAEEQANARSFREAVEKYGGGEKIQAEMEKNLKAKTGAKELTEDQRQRIAANIMGGTRGEAGAIAEVTGGGIGSRKFGQLYQQLSPAAKVAEEQAREEVREQHRAEEEVNRRTEQENARIDQARERESGRLAQSLQEPIGKMLLQDPLADIRSAILERLDRAGVGGAAAGAISPLIESKIRQQTEEGIQGRVAEKGITREAARAELTREQADREKREAEAERRRDEGPQRQFSMIEGTQSIVKSMQMAAFKQLDETPKEHLRVAKETKAVNVQIRDALKKPPYAVAKFRR